MMFCVITLIINGNLPNYIMGFILICCSNEPCNLELKREGLYFGKNSVE
jgi:hypothetical protein